MEKNTGRLQGKIAIITGSASGIGRAAAVMFALEGATLALADMQQEALDETLDMVKEAGGKVFTRITDVSVEDEVRDLVDETVKAYGRIDILCNNAGITGNMCSMDEWDGEDWMKVYAVNVMGAAYAIKELIKNIKEKENDSND